MNELLIEPFGAPIAIQAQVPGSKSISNRALILAYLTDKPIGLLNLLRSQDTDVLREAFNKLGVSASEADDGTVTVNGCAGRPPHTEADLYVANAGTVARFLPAALSLLPSGDFRMDGSEAMHKRPMAGLLECLKTLGSRVDCTVKDGFFPFRLRPSGWQPDTLTVDASRSSQILSGLLIASTRAERPMRLRLEGETVSKPFVEMTIRMMEQFGAKIDRDGCEYRITPGLSGPADGHYTIEPDASAASYFFALPLAVGGRSTVGAFPAQSLQGDLAFVDVLERMGLTKTTTAGAITIESSGPIQSVDIDFNAFSDTFLTLAALAPLLPGTTRIRGIGHTRHQETDRIHAMATELRKLGQGIEETENSLTITPNRAEMVARTASSPTAIDTYDDHRVAMSFGILGSHDLHGDGRPWLTIRNPECCGKTFPKFFEELARLRSSANAETTTHE